MNIKMVKENLKKIVNKEINFRFNAGRNQIEEFSGKIEKLYNCIFTVKVIGNMDKIKSFSYNDVLTDNLKIHIKQ